MKMNGKHELVLGKKSSHVQIGRFTLLMRLRDRSTDGHDLLWMCEGAHRKHEEL